jgi:hypothetical protein
MGSLGDLLIWKNLGLKCRHNLCWFCMMDWGEGTRATPTELTVTKRGGGGICKLGICDSVTVNRKWALFPPVIYGGLGVLRTIAGLFFDGHVLAVSIARI